MWVHIQLGRVPVQGHRGHAADEEQNSHEQTERTDLEAAPPEGLPLGLGMESSMSETHSEGEQLTNEVNGATRVDCVRHRGPESPQSEAQNLEVKPCSGGSMEFTSETSGWLVAEAHKGPGISQETQCMPGIVSIMITDR
jgi:hypothetical protein